MVDRVRVDSHVHIYRFREEGKTEKDGYQLWEYGDKPHAQVSDCVGTAQELVEQMTAPGISHAVVVKLFSANVRRDAVLAELFHPLRDDELGDVNAQVREQMVEFNRWA